MPILKRYAARVERLSSVHQGLRRSIINGETEAVREQVVTAGRLWHYLNRFLSRHHSEIKEAEPTRENTAQLRSIRDAYREIESGKAAYAEWLDARFESERNSGDDTVWVDWLLTPSFDSKRDLLILVGEVPRALKVAHRLRQRGVDLVVILDERASFDQYEHGIHLVHTRRTLSNVLSLPDFELVHGVKIWSIEQARIIEGELLEEVTVALQMAHHMAQTREDRGTLWQQNICANLGLIAQSVSVSHLQGCLQGRPGVVVSPGPSLKKNVHELKRLSRQVVIIAVNRTLGLLMEMGVTPDIVVSTDPLDLAYQFPPSGTSEHTVSVLSLCSHPHVVRLQKGPVCFFSAGAFEWLFDTMEPGQTGTVAACGSVSSSAFQLALGVGLNPIALLGQDLAFEGTSYYAPNTPDGSATVTVENNRWYGKQWVPMVKGDQVHSRKEAIESPVCRVKGWFGEEVVSTVEFVSYRRWFEAIAKLTGESTMLYNCTEGGAWIEGFEHLPLADFGKRLDTSPDTSPLKARAVMAGSAIDHRTMRLKRFMERLSQDIQTLVSRLDAVSRRMPSEWDEIELLLRNARDLPLLGLRRPLTLMRYGNDVLDSLDDTEYGAAMGELLSFVRTESAAVLQDLEHALTQMVDQF